MLYGHVGLKRVNKVICLIVGEVIVIIFFEKQKYYF